MLFLLLAYLNYVVKNCPREPKNAKKIAKKALFLAILKHFYQKNVFTVENE